MHNRKEIYHYITFFLVYHRRIWVDIISNPTFYIRFSAMFIWEYEGDKKLIPWGHPSLPLSSCLSIPCSVDPLGLDLSSLLCMEHGISYPLELFLPPSNISYPLEHGIILCIIPKHY